MPEVASYITERFPLNDFPENFSRQIYDRTDGNPLFLVESCALLEQRGDIEQGLDGSHHISSAWTAVGIPDKVESVLQERIQMLKSDLRIVLERAAVEGERFHPAALWDLASTVLDGWNEDRLEEALKTAEAIHGLIVAAKDEGLPGDLSFVYAFTHTLLQQAFYARLAPKQKQDLHLRLALCLEARLAGGASQLAPELSHHFRSGHDYRKAAEYCLSAAQRARQLESAAQAAEYARAGLVDLTKVTDAAADVPLQCDLQLALARAYRVLGRWKEALALVSQCVDMVEARADSPQLLKLLADKGDLLLVTGQWEAASQCFSRVATLAEQSSDIKARALAQLHLGRLFLQAGDYGRALKHFLLSCEACRESGDDSALTGGLSQLASVYTMLGRPEDARRALEEAIALARHRNDTGRLAGLYVNSGVEALLSGRHEEAEHRLNDGLSLCRKLGDEAEQATILTNLGELRRRQGRLAEAGDYLVSALEIIKRVGDTPGQVVVVANLGRIKHAQQDFLGAHQWYGVAYFLAGKVMDLRRATWLKHLMSETWEAMGNYAEALSAKLEAYQAELKMGDKRAAAGTLTAVGVMQLKSGNPDEAIKCWEIVRSNYAHASQDETRQLLATALDNLAVVHRDSNRLAEAIVYFQQARNVWQELGDSERVIGRLQDLYWAYSHLEDWDGAIKTLEMVIPLLESGRDRRDLGIAYQNLGATYSRKGELSRAAECLRQALDILRPMGELAQTTDCLLGLGNCLREAGNVAEAVPAYGEAIAVARTLGDVEKLAACLEQLTVALRDDQPAEALPHFAELVEIGRRTGNHRLLGGALHDTALILARQGKPDQAAETIKQALCSFVAAGDRVNFSAAAQNLVRVFSEQGLSSDQIRAAIKEMRFPQWPSMSGELST